MTVLSSSPTPQEFPFIPSFFFSSCYYFHCLVSSFNIFVWFLFCFGLVFFLFNGAFTFPSTSQSFPNKNA